MGLFHIFQIMNFDETVASITQAGLEWHRETIIANSRRNAAHVQRTMRDISSDSRPCLVISAGPSLYREKICGRIASNSFAGNIIATDGAYIQCLKAGITPDWVITLDPHPTRMVRWFGDPDYSENSKNDDYFTRQDLDVSFRANSIAQNAENIRLVDANPVKLAICTTAPANVVARTARMDRYWFAPLVDSPADDGLTRAIVKATGCPALNTGGTVGTAAWTFAHQVLGSGNIAIVGADLGYYLDTPLEQTQEWNMLKGEPNVTDLFPVVDTPFGKCRTSPTYRFYRDGFLDLLAASGEGITNCSGHGTLHGNRVNIVSLEFWLKSCS